MALASLSFALWLALPQPAVQAQGQERERDPHRALLPDETAAEAIRLTEALDPNSVTGGEVVAQNLVDEVLFRQMKERGIPHAALTTDEEFLRRVYLDAIGLPPEPETLRAFVADTNPKKRAAVIEELVGSQAFAEQWAWYWGDLFRLASQVGPVKNAFQFWIKEWLTTDRPYDEVVYDLLTGVAKAHGTLPSLAFLARSHQAKSRIVMSPQDYSIHNRLDAIDQFNVDVSRIFLGINTSCISCHDGAGHLEKVNTWLSNRTREEFYRHSAFLGRTRMVTTWDDRSKNVVVDLVVDDLAKGYNTANDAPYETLSEGRFPRLEGETYEPAFILTGETPREGESERAALARMITSHPQFARATVNLVWGKLMTVGFVEPYNAFDLDEESPLTPPSNPELLEALADDFTASGFSIHHLMKRIMASSAYQLQSSYPYAWNDDYVPFYPRKLARVLTGPEVVDSITQVTSRPPELSFSGTTVSRVKSLATPSDLGGRRSREGSEIDALMQSFFQSNRMTPPPEGNKGSTLQALLMMQSAVVNARVEADNGSRVHELVSSELSGEALVEELYVATLSRRPSEAETHVAMEGVSADRKRGAENLQWALLNSPEFLLNH